MRRVLAGESIRSIVYDLNIREITTGRGSLWQSANFRAMVMRPTNAAILTHQGREVGPGSWPPLITREEYDRVVAILTDPARKTTNRGTAVRYLLSGIARCAECDGVMQGAKEHTYPIQYRLADGTMRRTMRTQPYRYRCQTHGCRRVTQRMHDVDLYITENLLTLLENSGVQVLGGDADAAEVARTRVEAMRAKLALAADQYADDVLTGEQLQRINAKVRPQLDAAEAELRRVLPSADGLAKFTGSTTRQAWENADMEQRRGVIRALMSAGLKVVLGRSGKRRGGRSGPAEFNEETVRIYWPDAQ